MDLTTYFDMEFYLTHNGICLFPYGVSYGTLKFQFMEVYI